VREHTTERAGEGDVPVPLSNQTMFGYITAGSEEP
jgi:hypothetical protein